VDFFFQVEHKYTHFPAHSDCQGQNILCCHDSETGKAIFLCSNVLSGFFLDVIVGDQMFLLRM